MKRNLAFLCFGVVIGFTLGVILSYTYYANLPTSYNYTSSSQTSSRSTSIAPSEQATAVCQKQETTTEISICLMEYLNTVLYPQLTNEYTRLQTDQSGEAVLAIEEDRASLAEYSITTCKAQTYQTIGGSINSIEIALCRIGIYAKHLEILKKL